MRLELLAAALLGLMVAACGSEDDTTDGQNPGTQQCVPGAEYVAFDPVNHAPQDARLNAIEEMLNAFKAAQADPATSEAEAAEVAAIYADTSHNLKAKVQGRTAANDENAPVGVEIDATIEEAIDELAAATTATEVALAKQKFEKAGIYRFLYLSVIQELSEPSKKHYDEAFGYFGSGNANTEASRKGLARLAAGRDGNNGTTLNAELFALINDGKCAIAAALEAAGADTFDMHDANLPEAAPYHSIVHEIDDKLQVVFAYSIGHELIDVDANQDDADTATIKLWEADGFFVIVEPYLAKGTDAEKQFATEFRAALDAAIAKALADDTSWIGEFDAVGFLETVEALYGIDVKA
jgi:hypothetical protein